MRKGITIRELKASAIERGLNPAGLSFQEILERLAEQSEVEYEVMGRDRN